MPDETPEDKITLQVRWGRGENLPTLYANQFVISHAGRQEFYLLFGELTPPLVPDLNEALKKGEIPTTLDVKPVAKIVLSPDCMKRIAKVIAENVEIFEAQQQKGSEK